MAIVSRVCRMDRGLELPPLVVASVTSAAEDWQQTTAGTAGHPARVVQIIEHKRGLEIAESRSYLSEVQSSFLSFCPRWSNRMPAPACS